MTKQLANARSNVSPEQFFLNLSEDCSKYGITVQDCYNDYDKTADSSSLRGFERMVADYIGKQEGIFVPSGVMSQNMVLAMAKEKGNSNQFLVHWSSHLLIHEFDAFLHVLNMRPIIVPPDSPSITQSPLTYDGFAAALQNSDVDFDHPNLALVIIELPHREVGGKITPWDDLVKISQYCRQHHIHLHMDGARLWEATAGYADHSLAEITSLFDTVYVSFYKGIGAITGAMLLGATEYITASRVWLRRFGGNLYTHLPYFVSCLSNFMINRDHFHERKEKFVEVVQYLTQQLLQSELNLVDAGIEKYPLIFFDPPIPVVSLVHVYVRGDVTIATIANQLAAEQSGINCFLRLRPGRYGAKEYCYTEINMGPHNLQYTREDWLQGYQAFLHQLRRLLTVA